MSAISPRLGRLRAMLMRLPALLAVLILAALPPGVMPHAAGGSVEMVLCTGDGALRMVFDPATGQVKPEQTPNSARPGCDWAMAMALADLPPLAATLPTPVLTTRRAQLDLAVQLWRPAHDPRGIWARGPPSLI